MSKKPTKKDLEEKISQLEAALAMMKVQLEAYKESNEEISQQSAKRADKHQEVVDALVMWKSAYADAEQRCAQLQDRLNVLREVISAELAGSELKKAKDEAAREGIFHKIIQKVCKKLVEVEGFLHTFPRSKLPTPKVLEMVMNAAEKEDVPLARKMRETKATVQGRV
jgi:hypothetical protein